MPGTFGPDQLGGGLRGGVLGPQACMWQGESSLDGVPIFVMKQAPSPIAAPCLWMPETASTCLRMGPSLEAEAEARSELSSLRSPRIWKISSAWARNREWCPPAVSSLFGHIDSLGFSAPSGSQPISSYR